MRKQIIIYVALFVAVFTLVSAVLYFLFAGKTTEPPLPPAVGDSTAVADTTLVVAVDSLAAMRPDTLEVAANELPDPLVEYNNLMLLRKRLIDFYSKGEIRTYTSTEVDSIFTGFVAQIDSLAYKQQQYIAKINELNRALMRSNSQVAALEAKATQLEENISIMESGGAEDEATAAVEQKKLKEAAGMIENMQPANAAQSLLPLTDNEIVALLRNMSVRRASKILDEMPDMRAASLMRTMSAQ